MRFVRLIYIFTFLFFFFFFFSRIIAKSFVHFISFSEGCVGCFRPIIYSPLTFL